MVGPARRASPAPDQPGAMARAMTRACQGHSMQILRARTLWGTMPLGRASSHGGAVNLVRSGTKQPQPFSASAEGQARPPHTSLPQYRFPLIRLRHATQHPARQRLAAPSLSL
ncbi:hypothetical protein CBM2599_A120387 [Cupriavidus taiwanensis]|nr:hypothetical protein CBM2599_A120387 [Cupriavidus taiwanensis]SOY81791.1 hypothetical protein CBM2600_A120409 [Cupriavidus taiwanensis]